MPLDPGATSASLIQKLIVVHKAAGSRVVQSQNGKLQFEGQIDRVDSR